MNAFIWRFRAALAYYTLADVPFRIAFEMAGVAVEMYCKDGFSPRDAVLEDLSYWAD